MARLKITTMRIILVHPLNLPIAPLCCRLNMHHRPPVSHLHLPIPLNDKWCQFYRLLVINIIQTFTIMSISSVRDVLKQRHQQHKEQQEQVEHKADPTAVPTVDPKVDPKVEPPASPPVDPIKQFEWWLEQWTFFHFSPPALESLIDHWWSHTPQRMDKGDPYTHLLVPPMFRLRRSSPPRDPPPPHLQPTSHTWCRDARLLFGGQVTPKSLPQTAYEELRQGIVSVSHPSTVMPWPIKWVGGPSIQRLRISSILYQSFLASMMTSLMDMDNTFMLVFQVSIPGLLTPLYFRVEEDSTSHGTLDSPMLTLSEDWLPRLRLLGKDQPLYIRPVHLPSLRMHDTEPALLLSCLRQGDEHVTEAQLIQELNQHINASGVVFIGQWFRLSGGFVFQILLIRGHQNTPVYAACVSNVLESAVSLIITQDEMIPRQQGAEGLESYPRLM